MAEPSPFSFPVPASFPSLAPMILASVDVGNAPLSFHIRRRLRLGGQLQHGRVLTYAQTSEQHDLPVWELKRIVI